MGDTEESRIAQLKDEILKYLGAHPQAADTVEGIANWWLPRQRYEEEIQKVQQALDDLVERGLVTKTTLADGTILYEHLGQRTGHEH
jgi:Fe2+ or Zn2+ uptake regulation protein